MARIISFNINGIRARQHQLEAIREELDPDVMGLQEIKVDDEKFPLADVESLGWHVEYFGQKSHYGVALVSRDKPIFVQKGYPWADDDAQKRMIHARYILGGRTVDVINGYFPQGENRKHETKFPAKETFYADLNRYLSEDLADAEHIVVMGDMNISPEDIDIGIGEPNRKRWLQQGKCSFLPEEREWYGALLDQNLADTYRQHFPEDNTRFSWFDYRSRGFNDEPKRGLRIDHILVTPELLAACSDVGISYDIRGMEKPSDHAPIWADFAD
ncbi:Exodeoxyribonuclease III [BD1-7 clade bacterium]|uniref:Exodeoxyribonuclease III n=1 Tax=BD1-7 clade bacterium TaxID=2029982 RepID=A0A5S9PNF0_9GAMM|nr:Exodeoxyribonuclease III [BD1-7 clade bacterium]CAA0105676.1 Exodeoxyribonuclease III [BD1-7 clade bacterium]